MIFMWFLARSSRGTGPKMRVPIGSFLFSTSTASFLSKRITLPSGGRMSFAVRTTTAFITSPFLMRPRGIASLIDTTMMSPTEAYFRFEPPSTLMHMTRRAPELSATSRFVCIWIIGSDPLRLLLVGAALRQNFPGFCFRLRRAFDDAGDVAGLVDVGFVVRVVLLGPAHGLLQQRVEQSTLDLHHHGLVAL